MIERRNTLRNAVDLAVLALTLIGLGGAVTVFGVWLMHAVFTG